MLKIQWGSFGHLIKSPMKTSHTILAIGAQNYVREFCAPIPEFRIASCPPPGTPNPEPSTAPLTPFAPLMSHPRGETPAVSPHPEGRTRGRLTTCARALR